METLTSKDLERIRVMPIINEFLEVMSTQRSIQREARIMRLEMELEHLQDSGPRRHGVLHPSSLHLGGKVEEACMRKLAYARKQQRSPYTPAEVDALRIFETGHDSHGKFQGWLKYIFGDRFEAEVPAIIDEMQISGHCDGLLQFDLDGRMVPVVMEFKTINDNGWQKLRKTPLGKHVDQALVYMKALGAPVAIFIYENKNNQQVKELVIQFNDKLDRWERLEGRVENILAHLQQGSLPRTKPGWACKNCPFTQECKPFDQKGLGIARLKQAVRKGKHDKATRNTRLVKAAG